MGQDSWPVGGRNSGRLLLQICTVSKEVPQHLKGSSNLFPEARSLDTCFGCDRLLGLKEEAYLKVRLDTVI